MSSYDDDDPSADVDTGPITVALFIGLGIGALLGWSSGRNEMRKIAGEWAVQTARQCEVSYRTDGYESVADCLKGAIDEAEEERREEAHAEAEGFISR